MMDPETRRILELAKVARTPSAADKSGVEQKLLLALGTSAFVAAGTSATAKAGLGGALKWWLLAGGALAGSAALGYVMLAASAPAKAPASSTQTARAAKPDAPAAAPLVVKPVTAAQEPPAGVPEPSPSTHATRATLATTGARSEHKPESARAASLGDELDLLHLAQRAWRGRRAADAIALLDQHRARFPHSALGLERDALQALALCELGRDSEARRLAQRVIARAPQSPLRASLEQSCALK